jgi:hypothetical protein
MDTAKLSFPSLADCSINRAVPLPLRNGCRVNAGKFVARRSRREEALIAVRLKNSNLLMDRSIRRKPDHIEDQIRLTPDATEPNISRVLPASPA